VDVVVRVVDIVDIVYYHCLNLYLVIYSIFTVNRKSRRAFSVF